MSFVFFFLFACGVGEKIADEQIEHVAAVTSHSSF
jgi:hypothetical protein